MPSAAPSGRHRTPVPAGHSAMSPGRNGPRLGVHVTDEQARPVGGALARWLAAVAPASARGDVNIALVSDRTIRRLNRRYRKLDKTTDVLSFPAVAHSEQRTKD